MVAALVFALTQVSQTVAILPVINRTPEESDQLRSEMVIGVTEFLPKAFKANGFQVVDSQSVDAALKKGGVDLEDEELHRRETFMKIGEALNADYVYFSSIESTGFFSANTGKAVIRVWFLDVKNKGRILSSRAIQGESRQIVGGSPKSAEVTSTVRAGEQSVKLILKQLNRAYQAPK